MSQGITTGHGESKRRDVDDGEEDEDHPFSSADLHEEGGLLLPFVRPIVSRATSTVAFFFSKQ